MTIHIPEWLFSSQLWSSVGIFIGGTVLGIVLTIAVFAYMFRNWKVF